MSAPAFTLDLWRAEDGEAFFRASNDPELYRFMSDGFPKTPEACTALVRRFAEVGDAGQCVRRITVDGRPVGCIAAFFEGDTGQKSAGIAYWIAAEYRGRGIMTQALGRFSALLFGRFGLRRLCARPCADNTPSRRLLERSGFTCECVLREGFRKDGRLLDAALYSLCSTARD